MPNTEKNRYTAGAKVQQKFHTSVQNFQSSDVVPNCNYMGTNWCNTCAEMVQLMRFNSPKFCRFSANNRGTNSTEILWLSCAEHLTKQQLTWELNCADLLPKLLQKTDQKQPKFQLFVAAIARSCCSTFWIKFWAETGYQNTDAQTIETIPHSSAAAHLQR